MIMKTVLYFFFFSMLGNSNCIKRILDDASVLLVIYAARIGILAQLNKLLYKQLMWLSG